MNMLLANVHRDLSIIKGNCDPPAFENVIGNSRIQGQDFCRSPVNVKRGNGKSRNEQMNSCLLMMYGKYHTNVWPFITKMKKQ
jgi:hypothetical protein